MRYIVTTIVFTLMIVSAISESYAAGVAEASVETPKAQAPRAQAPQSQAPQAQEPQAVELKIDASNLSPEETKWFTTFYEGTFYADGWQEIAQDILVKIEPEERQEKLIVLAQLGDKIGREWCKGNEARKIDTSMLREWGKQLRTTAEKEPHLLTEVLLDIDGEVDSIID